MLSPKRIRPTVKSTPSRYSGMIPSDLLSIKNLSTEYVNLIMEKAEQMKVLVSVHGGDDRLKHRVLATVFYEPSTRTCCSFQTAMLRLGGSVVSVNESHSSIKKGETLEDTIQTVASYCDAVVLRHPQKGSAGIAAAVSAKPVINAGDGIGEHPTQALLDLYTILSELGLDRIGRMKDGPDLVIALLGDLKNGRTVHSLVYLLSRYEGISLVYCAPQSLALPQDIYEELAALGVKQESKTLAEAIEYADVLYVTRVQKERFTSEEEYAAVKGSYCVDNDVMKHAKAKMVVMHPLPRVDEIATEVDSDPRAAYFRKIETLMQTAG